MPRKVCVVVTARASYARIRSALEAIRQHPDLELQLVVAASALLDRYGNAVQVIEREGFRIDRKVYMIVEGENLVTSAKSTGFGMAELATIFDDLHPDAVVTIADRFETMATAVAASYMNLPLIHVQGGEVTGSIDEKVRHAITKIADLHFVATEKAAERVIRMGERPDRVFATGCPSIDLAKVAIERPAAEIDLFSAYGGVGARLDLSNGYIVVLQHPVTTEYSESRRHIEETLHAVAELDLPTLWFWPNVDAGSDGTSKGIRAFRETHTLPHVHFFKNLPPDDFIRLLHGSRCIVGNSSVSIRECAYLGVPAVNIGSRQAGRDRGRNVIDVDYDRGEIRSAIQRHIAAPRPPADLLYGDGRAGERMADLVARLPLSIAKQLTY
ncbi:UDP-N-acetylglucosamine 2-epimerase [Rhodospirillaceae bacterium SYSU D60014]|uniref:UDP-N-acetylglucosamine 2-epimerase n=1 Tax=Virgifigura deserti TaxID=2268457 RepID=UPI000E66849B